ncbi:hypothetical protein SESBI_49218 [Sesbania bispinosa]|nr:hypothetical protein SESBI_49218 [Sesbania bispinosa]
MVSYHSYLLYFLGGVYSDIRRCSYPTNKTPPKKAGLYGRLDQIQDQMFSSFGRFPINSFMDLVFLQYFLYERFPEYAPVRTVPDPVLDGATRPLEPRVWGWTMGHPRQLLSEILDEEAQFVHRPYTINLFPGVEPLSHIYCPVPPWILITDNVSAAGGAFWPFAYRPDRVCCRFGLDQAPCNVDLEFRDVSESKKAVLFKSTDALPKFDAAKFIPSDRVGRVLDIWIMYKDPYFVTTFTRKIEKTAKTKGAFSLRSHRVRRLGGSQEKKVKTSPYLPSSTPSSPKKSSHNRSPKVRKVPVAGTRASERLKAKPSHKVEEDSPLQSSKAQATTQGSSVGPNAEEETAESPNSDHDADVDGYVPDSVSKECVNSPTCVEVAHSESLVEATDALKEHGNPSTVIPSLEVIDSAPPVDVTPLEVIDSVPPIDATSLEAALPSPVITPPVGASGEKETIMVGSGSRPLSRRFDHNVPPAALEDLGKIIEAASGCGTP